MRTDVTNHGVVVAIVLLSALCLAGASYFVATLTTEKPVIDYEVLVESTEDSIEADVPNGGLEIDPASVDWGTVWETDHFIQRELTIGNPHSFDVHLVLDRFPCGLSVYPDELTILAGSDATFSVTVLPSTRNAARLEADLEFEWQFAFRIEEFPGRHPGWTITTNVQRAMSVQHKGDQSWLVAPLRELRTVQVEATPEGTRATVTGPDHFGKYHVSVERNQHEAGEQQKLWIHAETTSGAQSSRRFYF